MIFAVALAVSCVPVSGDRILAREIAAVEPVFRSVPGETVVGLAPAPGVQRVFAPGEMNGFVRRHGGQGVVSGPVCFEWPVRSLTADEVREAMLAVVPGGSVEVLALSKARVPTGALTFSLSGLRGGIWRGFVQYAVGRKVDVWARVRVEVPFTRLVAARALRAGERIDAAACRVESGRGAPGEPDVLTRMEEAVGATARRLIAEGAPVRASDVIGVAAVSKGEAVRVDVIAGPARVSFTATAITSGNIGQTIAVQNPLNKKTLQARVTGTGRAVIGVGR